MSTYKIISLISLLAWCSLGFSQSGNHQKNKEKIEAYRAQFLAEQLALTPEEAQVFWPLYNQYREELEEILSERGRPHARGGERARQELENMSDAEIREKLEREIENQQAMINLRKAYLRKFDAVLPTKKVGLLYIAEGEFQRRLIRQLGDNPPPAGTEE